MNWYNLVLECIRDLCSEKNRKDFTLLEIYTYVNEMEAYYPHNKHIKDKIRQQLQILRDEGTIKFTKIPGNYTLEKK